MLSATMRIPSTIHGVKQHTLGLLDGEFCSKCEGHCHLLVPLVLAVVE